MPSKARIHLRSIAIALVICGPGSLDATDSAPAGREFEFEVRELVFQGLDGDVTALERALALCRKALDADERDAQALVWHGSTSLVLAGVAYESSDFSRGALLWQRGLDEMSLAVELEPDNVAVLIPRAAALLGVARNVPFPDQASSLARTAVGDYERVLELQRPYFGRMSVHARGELLLGLADGHHRLGNEAKVRDYMQLALEELPDTPYADDAEAYLSAGPDHAALRVRTCKGCHSSSHASAGR